MAKIKDRLNEYSTIITDECDTETFREIIRNIISKAKEGSLAHANFLRASLIVPAARINTTDKLADIQEENKSINQEEEEEKTDWREFFLTREAHDLYNKYEAEGNKTEMEKILQDKNNYQPGWRE